MSSFNVLEDLLIWSKLKDLLTWYRYTDTDSQKLKADQKFVGWAWSKLICG